MDAAGGRSADRGAHCSQGATATDFTLRDVDGQTVRLSDLRGTLQGNDKLEELLLEAVGNTEKLDKLKGELGPGGSNA